MLLLLKEVSLLFCQAEAGITQMRGCREVFPTPRSPQTPSGPGRWATVKKTYGRDMVKSLSLDYSCPDTPKARVLGTPKIDRPPGL